MSSGNFVAGAGRCEQSSDGRRFASVSGAGHLQWTRQSLKGSNFEVKFPPIGGGTLVTDFNKGFTKGFFFYFFPAGLWYTKH